MKLFSLFRSSYFSADRGSQSVTENVTSDPNPECEQLLIESNGTEDFSENSTEPMTSVQCHGGPSSSDQRTEVNDEEIQPPKPDIFAPPPYEEVETEESDLPPPTYEEVERLKAIEADGGVRLFRMDPPLAPMEPSDERILLGTDLMFLAAFTGAFLFNLIGIVLLLCMCHTIAGRCGAMAGFGLSLAKWVFIFRNSPELSKDSNVWLVWLIMVLGFMIFVRSILRYVSAKRELLPPQPQNIHHEPRMFFLF